ncbi:MAG: hypothetical protein J6F31_05260 [Oscillospiraceae bacterium]|nr:hypothetical protein [Oscillospiraceae bacterium]
MTTKQYRKASAEIKRQYRRKMRKQRPLLTRVGLPVVLTILVAACGVSIIKNKVELEHKKQELAAIEEQAALLEAENASYQSILDEEDERRYMERIATERLGYAYPDERRFYDTVQIS